MKKFSILFALFAVLFTSACKNDDNGSDDNPPVNNSGMVEVSGDITANTTWTADKIYLLKGFVYVTNGATLTIQPGTIIKGDKPTKGTLVITRGAKIMAVGTVEKPIVFTSNLPAGGRAQGDWGGVILLGKAPGNQGLNVTLEGGLDPKNDAAKYTQFGGTDAADNSGKLKYVRIEYAGIPFSPDNEINSLTMGGVGNGTEIDYVSVHRAGDDAFEWFGGTVNCKHLVAIGTWDDDFDTDQGFSGKIQFALAQRAQVVADFSGSNGFESDGNSGGTNASPKTSAIFSNVTIVGPKLTVTTGSSGLNANYQHAVQIRRNSSISIFNSIFANYTEGIFIDDALPAAPATENSSANFLSGDLVFANNIVYNSNNNNNQIKGTGANKARFEAAFLANNIFDPTKGVTDLLVEPLKYGSDFKASNNSAFGKPNFTLKAGAVALTGAAYTHPKVADAFFEKVAYKGAFGTTDWTAGWVNYDPQNLPYTTPGAVN